MRRYLVAAVAVGLVALAAACGGGKSNGAQPTKTAVPNTPSDPNAQELQALSAKFGTASFEVHYAINDTGSDQPLNGFITIYKQGRDRTRFDVASNDSGETVSLVLLQTPENSVFCLPGAGALAQLAGVEDGSGVCFKNDANSPAPDLSAITDNFAQISDGDINVTSKSTRTILGAAATCFDYTSDGGDTKSTTCFTADGVPLYDKSTSGSETTELDAVQIKPQPSSDVFNPPYPVKDFPTETAGQ
ncbi:MAG TPA: hypothetical protein VFY79_04130 [Dehalococcoidia bacterium]|nr:hypothetical protein [Dehalococcoidia bacterium]